MQALITGITGFVGSHLAEYILQHHPDVKVAGLLRWRSPKHNIASILESIDLYYGDLQDIPSIRQLLVRCKPEAIFHLAAQSYVDFSFVRSLCSNIKRGTGSLRDSSSNTS